MIDETSSHRWPWSNLGKRNYVEEDNVHLTKAQKLISMAAARSLVLLSKNALATQGPPSHRHVLISQILGN
jgi:hypothetical protein